MPSQQTEYPLDFKDILFHTGDISKKGFNIEYGQFNEKSNKELLNAIDYTFSTLFEEKSSFYDQTTGFWKITDNFINQEITDQHTITAKLFLLDNTKLNDALDSLEHIQTQFGAKYIDTLIISQQEKRQYEQLESWIQSGKIRRLGLTDVDCQTLKTLIKNKNMVPTVNQVNIRDLNMHKELIELAKGNGIELLHNSDRTDILTEKELTLLMQRYNLLDNSAKVTPSWVLKYSVFIPFRQILIDKGYIIKATCTEESK